MQKKLQFFVIALLGVLLLAPLLGFPATLDAQKISEIKANGAETLPAFLARLPSSFEAQVFYGLAGSALLGMMVSWAWKWAQGSADGWKHFTVRYVVGQVLWIMTSCGGVIAATGFATESGEFFGWLTVIVMGASLGYNGDVKTKATPDAGRG